MRSIFIPFVLTLTLAACQGLPLSVYSFDVSSGDVLFQDDFSDPASGWERIAHESIGVLDYTDGSYGIFVSARYQLLWASPQLEFEDVRIEVDATNLNDLRDDNFGVVCRAKDVDNFYFAVISSDGYYGIGKVNNGVQRLLDIPAMLPSEDINQGAAVNHLRLDCITEEISLSVNNVLLYTVTDEDFETGDVGLLAGTFAEPGTRVLFDNFTVIKP
jgi:hypothetical protein